MLAALIAALLALSEVLIITRAPGPGLDPDSASYLGSAESLAHGNGLTIPMAEWYDDEPTSPLSHFPPGLPIALATTIKLGFAPTQGARVVNALAQAVTVGIVTYIVATTGGIFAGVVVAIAVLVGRPFVLASLAVLSEPLFLALLSLALWGMIFRWPAALVGLVAALAALVRYAGISLLAAVALWQLMNGGSIGRRIKNAGLSVVPTIVLFGAWVIHTRVERGPTAIRQFGIYGGIGQDFLQGIQTIGGWLSPTTDDSPHGPLWAWLAALSGLLALVVLIGGVRRARRDSTGGRRLFRAAGMIAGCYVVVLIASRLLADPGIPFDERILVPLILLATLAIVLAGALAWPHWGLLLRGIIGGALLAWVIAASSASLDEATWAVTNGSDFAGEDWRTSEVLAWVRRNAPNTPLYSNWPAAIYFHVHRPAWLLPPPGTSVSEWRAFADTLARRHGIVVAFDAPSPDVAPPDSIAAAGHLHAIARLHDGILYGPAQQGTSPAPGTNAP